jgi:RNA polymerase sigma-70 factor (ECF subfamily)
VRAAHARLVAGDRLASEELAGLLLGPVVARLERRWPRWKHTDLLHDAAVDVILDYIEAPDRYNPERGSLVGWLEMAAHRDVANVYQSAKQRVAIDTPPLSAFTDPARPADLVLPAGAIPVGLTSAVPDPADADRLDARFLLSRIRQMCPDERERRLIWACWVEGERSSDRLAKILGVSHLSAKERRLKVKNARDVARRKLRRIGLSDHGQD